MVTTDWLVQVAPAFRGWVGGPQPSWGELAEAAGYVRAELEIGKHAWGQARVVLGRMEAIAALAVVATRHGRGEVRSPEQLLRKMVELHGTGALRLDKSLFGLMEVSARVGSMPEGEARRRPESATVTDGDSPLPPRPLPVRPTAAWLAEQRAKSLAYEERRRCYTEAWHRGSEPEAEPDPPSGQAPGGGARGRRPSRGRIHDPRQGKLDV